MRINRAVALLVLAVACKDPFDQAPTAAPPAPPRVGYVPRDAVPANDGGGRDA